jgi:hypothetical protein
MPDTLPLFTPPIPCIARTARLVLPPGRAPHGPTAPRGPRAPPWAAEEGRAEAERAPPHWLPGSGEGPLRAGPPCTGPERVPPSSPRAKVCPLPPSPLTGCSQRPPFGSTPPGPCSPPAGTTREDAAIIAQEEYAREKGKPRALRWCFSEGKSAGAVWPRQETHCFNWPPVGRSAHLTRETQQYMHEAGSNRDATQQITAQHRSDR